MCKAETFDYKYLSINHNTKKWSGIIGNKTEVILQEDNLVVNRNVDLKIFKVISDFQNIEYRIITVKSDKDEICSIVITDDSMKIIYNNRIEEYFK